MKDKTFCTITSIACFAIAVFEGALSLLVPNWGLTIFCALIFGYAFYVGVEMWEARNR